ncbi:MAG TPA: hypothetical protein VKV05_03040 [Terriglobales bacterium]|nr:hypothetical protein [Terriglobales bacterium]
MRTRSALTCLFIFAAAGLVLGQGVAMASEVCRQGMVRRWRSAAFLGTLIVLGFCSNFGSAQSSNLDSFALCLAQKKVTMYGSFLCPHCNDQKKMFGTSFRHVPYVECSVRGSRQESFPCMAAQIRFTPTWIFADGNRLVGVQSLQTLSEKSGCKLP